MLSTNSESALTENLAKALANSLFPALDSALRAGRHISRDDLDNYALLSDYEIDLGTFYRRYNCELVRAPEGFFYLRPRSTSLIGKSVMSELDMLIGKVLCFLYLSPERLAQEGVFSNQDLYDELLAIADEKRLMRFVGLKATGTDLDREKLFEKVRGSLRRLKRVGMLLPIGDTNKFSISEACFRFGADVRSGEDIKEAQLRLIRDGEAVVEPKHRQASLLDEQTEINHDTETHQQQLEGEA
ncbi:condesin subunit E [Vibrio sp. qd031]|jgi:chromosome partition protein MukE|uniref:Chromosome partition protein MukE n=1 Tax=Vibrio ulleungensis TaxID=2807619 RepID=A0ABS2HF26_9VIBR|nr:MULTISPECIES: chromosome partition protein MukE [Vibrio]MBM7036168.1 chromosome partition protein MukE [Vibrio ulleungensis]ORT49485.1 condesin subunit E [Vibrio sp. qd031]